MMYVRWKYVKDEGVATLHGRLIAYAACCAWAATYVGSKCLGIKWEREKKNFFFYFL